MSTQECGMPVDPNAEPLADYGKAAIMIPLIIGGAVVVSLIILWRTYAQKVQMAEMARVEMSVRQELGEARAAVRDRKPNIALMRVREARGMLDSLKKGFSSGYARLNVSILMLEGEALFMKDGVRSADRAEVLFDSALGLMSSASGERWELGMLARARMRFELRRYGDALADLDAMLDRNPNFGVAYYWRSLTREVLGDKQGAKADERRARALDSWPPLRDFLHAGGGTRDILAK